MGLPSPHKARPIGDRLDLLGMRRDREHAGRRTPTRWPRTRRRGRLISGAPPDVIWLGSARRPHPCAHRRAPGRTQRGYEAGPEGLEILVIGAPNLGEAPREDVDGQRDWWAD